MVFLCACSVKETRCCAGLCRGSSPMGFVFDRSVGTFAV